jgi:purine-cytosine permease-like protein
MQREQKLVAWFVLALGCAGIVAGASILAGGSSQAEGLSCKAICGLVLLTTTIFGDSAGTFVGGLLWLAVGSVFFWFGYRVLRAQHHGESKSMSD